MIAAILDGLGRDGAPIRALNAHLPPPSDVSGTALVVDVGGTNMRAAVVTVKNGQATFDKGPVTDALDARDVAITGPDFFAVQADLVTKLDPPMGLPVGYCFSYPSEVLPDLDARLIAWTKGIAIPDVVGSLVGTKLGEALGERGLAPTRVHVLNDTVASLIGGALGDRDPRRVIGLIAGTGSNMAAFFEPSVSSKLPEGGPLAVNLESGNFPIRFLTEADARVDQESPNVGAQRFEKAVGGIYLPYVYRALGGDIDVTLGSGELVRRRQNGDEIAGSVLERSARLVATGIAAVAEARQQPSAVVVVAEGSLFWRDPMFKPAVERELSSRLGGRSYKIRRRKDANLIGSAVAALYQRTVR
nr:hexokinase-3-like [Nerophis lumbriciformis]